MVHGANLLTEVDGTQQRLGFYTNIVVEAFTAADAGSRAVDAIRADTRLRDLILNPEHDPIRLSAEEVQESEAASESPGQRTAFMLYPDSGP